jgi:hypothetical protein
MGGSSANSGVAGFGALSGTSGTGGGTSGSSGKAFEACAGETAEAEALSVVIELLVDLSTSMLVVAPGTNITKWEVTRDAVLSAVDNMPSTTALGATFYPNAGIGDSECYQPEPGVTIDVLGAPGSDQRAQISDMFNSEGPQGGTPTHPAYLYSLGLIRETTLPGTRYVLLITDGAPTWGLNCSGDGRTPIDNEPLILEAQKAAARGIRTFVVGSPGSESAVQDLSRMATAGLTARAGCSDDGPTYCHFDMTQEPDFAAALRRALAEIVGATLNCEYPVPPPPAGQELNPNLVNVVFTSSDGDEHEVLQSAAPEDCTSGWRYSDDGNSVILCGESCDLVKADPAGSVEVLFGCETQVEIR